MRRMPVVPWLALGSAIFMPGCSQPQPPAAVAPQPPAAVAVQPAAAPEAAPAAGAGLAALIEAVSKTDGSGDRVVTIDQIADLGQNAKPALEALVKATSDPDLRVRWHAARAIGLIGEDASSAVPVLVKLLADPDPIVAAQAAAAIGAIRGDEDAATITAADTALYADAQAAVAGAIVHQDPRVRRAAMRALRQFDPSPAMLAPLFARQLADADPSVVLPALHTLADLEEVAVPVLVEALADPKSRYWAAIGLAAIGEDAAAAAKPLATLAAEGEVHERLQAVLALAAIGEKAAVATPAVVAAMQSPDVSLRAPAAYALGKMRAAAADAALQQVAATEDAVPAAIASWALAQIHPGEPRFVAEAVARLTKGLSSDAPGVRKGAVAGLSDLAPQLDDAQRQQLAAAFVSLISDPEPDVGRAAGAALIRLGGGCVDTLRGKLADPAVRTHVLEILAGIGPAAKPAIDDIVRELGDADADHAGEAAVAIGAIGPDAAAAAVPALRRLVTDANARPGLRYAAGYALGRMGPAAKEAAADLRALSESADELLATVAVWAALKMEPEDASLVERAVPLLRRALRAEDELARLEAEDSPLAVRATLPGGRHAGPARSDAPRPPPCSRPARRADGSRGRCAGVPRHARCDLRGVAAWHGWGCSTGCG